MGDCDAILPMSTYITDIQDSKIILGLQLCIHLGLIVIKCDDDCKCKNIHVADTSALTSTENKWGNVDIGLTLPPIPLDTKINETNAKAHIMQLYPDFFDGVGTIKNAVVHLDVKPGAPQ